MPDYLNTIYQGDAADYVASLPDDSLDCVITSPPYWSLKDYGIDGQTGLEPNPAAYIAALMRVFEPLKAKIKAGGVLFVNIGDTYVNHRPGNFDDNNPFKGADTARPRRPPHRAIKQSIKNKSMAGIPARFQIAMIDAGYICRADLIWAKTAYRAVGVQDRPETAHEYIYMFTISERYHFDLDRLKEYGITSTILAAPVTRGGTAHKASYDGTLIEPLIAAATPDGGVVCDPYMGTGTSAYIAAAQGLSWTGAELNPDFIEIANERLKTVQRSLL